MCSTHAVVSFYEREKKLLQFKSKEIMCAITCNHTHTLFSPDAHISRARVLTDQKERSRKKEWNIEINEAPRFGVKSIV